MNNFFYYVNRKPTYIETRKGGVGCDGLLILTESFDSVIELLNTAKDYYLEWKKYCNEGACENLLYNIDIYKIYDNKDIIYRINYSLDENKNYLTFSECNLSSPSYFNTFMNENKINLFIALLQLCDQFELCEIQQLFKYNRIKKCFLWQQENNFKCEWFDKKIFRWLPLLIKLYNTRPLLFKNNSLCDITIISNI